MSASAQPLNSLPARFETLSLARLDDVLAVEQQAYSHPWTRGNFTDALASGYQAQVLMAGDHLLGYFVAMMGVDEVHLLNITVAPEYQRQGWARVLLDALAVFDCVVDEMMVAHSHAAMIGEIKAVLLSPRNEAPLLYADGQYTTLAGFGDTP